MFSENRTEFLENLVLFMIVGLVFLAGFGIGSYTTQNEAKSETNELKQELKQAVKLIEQLEENQTIIYHADSWGGNYDYKSEIQASE